MNIFAVIGEITRKRYSVQSVNMILNMILVVFLLSCLNFYQNFLNLRPRSAIYLAEARSGAETGNGNLLGINAFKMPLELSFTAFNNKYAELMIVTRFLPGTELKYPEFKESDDFVVVSNSFINPRLNLKQKTLYYRGQTLFLPLKGAAKYYPFDSYKLELNFTSELETSRQLAEKAQKIEVAERKSALNMAVKAVYMGRKVAADSCNLGRKYSWTKPSKEQQGSAYNHASAQFIEFPEMPLKQKPKVPNLILDNYKNYLPNLNIAVQNYTSTINYSDSTHKLALELHFSRPVLLVILLIAVFLATILLAFQHLYIAFLNNSVTKRSETQYVIFTMLIIGLGFFTRDLLLLPEQNFTYFADLLYLFTLFLPLLALISRIARLILLIPGKIA